MTGNIKMKRKRKTMYTKTNMKYIITESKLDGAITNYLDSMFDVKNIKVIHPVEDDDEDGNPYEDYHRAVFYIGDNYFDGEEYFRWYGKQYFERNTNMSDKVPVVDMESEYYNRLDGYFGDLWEEPFKEWFTKNFKFSVKSVE